MPFVNTDYKTIKQQIYFPKGVINIKEYQLYRKKILARYENLQELDK